MLPFDPAATELYSISFGQLPKPDKRALGIVKCYMHIGELVRLDIDMHKRENGGHKVVADSENKLHESASLCI